MKKIFQIWKDCHNDVKDNWAVKACGYATYIPLLGWLVYCFFKQI